MVQVIASACAKLYCFQWCTAKIHLGGTSPFKVCPWASYLTFLVNKGVSLWQYSPLTICTYRKYIQKGSTSHHISEYYINLVLVAWCLEWDLWDDGRPQCPVRCVSRDWKGKNKTKQTKHPHKQTNKTQTSSMCWSQDFNMKSHFKPQSLWYLKHWFRSV